jgi:hypothetical protein
MRTYHRSTADGAADRALEPARSLAVSIQFGRTADASLLLRR